MSILNIALWVRLLKHKREFVLFFFLNPSVVPISLRVKLEVLILIFKAIMIWHTVHSLSLFIQQPLSFLEMVGSFLPSTSLFIFDLFSKAFSCHHFQNFNPLPTISHFLSLFIFFLFLSDNCLSFIFCIYPIEFNLLKGRICVTFTGMSKVPRVVPNVEEVLINNLYMNN